MFPQGHATTRTASGFDPGYDYINRNVNEVNIPLDESVDWTEYVTSQQIQGHPIQSSDSRTRVRMLLPVQVPGFVIRQFEANERLPSSTTSQDVVELEIGCSAFILIKVDQAIARNETLAAYISQVSVGAEQNRVKLMLRYAAELMSAGVDPTHRGSKAGLYQNNNLGTITSPLAWAPDEVFTICLTAQLLLQGSKSWTDGEMFAIVPLEATAAIEQNIEGKISATTANDEKFHVKAPKHIYGFDFIVDLERTLYRQRKNNYPVYELIFGNRNATLLYCSPVTMEYSDNTDLTVMHSYLRCLITFGGAVIKPTGLVSVIAAIDTPKTRTI